MECRNPDAALPLGRQLHANRDRIDVRAGNGRLLEVLNVTPWTGGENNDVGNCTTQIVISAQTDQTRISASLLCNCPIRCPAVAAPISPELDNNSSLSISSADLLPVEQQKELDRLKHNRGFWLYFILRIIASGSLATTSFSMFVSFNLRVFIRN
jgi:hypothetical protein